jgi:transposase
MSVSGKFQRARSLRRNALGFRNLTHYRIRSLLHCSDLTALIDAL